MKKTVFLIAIAAFCSAVSFAQFTYQAANCVNTTGSYSDLGGLGTVIDSNYDGLALAYTDDVSRAYNIGFTFNFNGDTYNKFFLSTNGYIKLANDYSIPPDAFGLPPYSNIFDSNLIAPFYTHLDAGSLSPTEYRYYTSGAVGSRVCTIQFKNVHDVDISSLASQYANASFQIKLYEANSNIEFVYGTFTASSAAPTPLLGVIVGIIGNTSNDQSVNVTKTSTSAWSGGTFINGPYPGNYFNTRNNVLVDAGRTFRFVANPLPTNDAKVTEVYTLGEIPIGYGFPHRVSAIVKNNGIAPINNLVVTLNVSGANSHTLTKTISSLGAGVSTTIQFDTFSSFNPGIDTVRVSVPSDEYNSNNESYILQNVGTEIFSYADSSAPFGQIGFGVGSGTILTKYYMNGTARVRYVRVYISADLNNQGKVVRAVLLNSSGTILKRSPDYYLSGPDLDNWVTFELDTAQEISNSSFYVGLAQLADVNAYYPVSFQRETVPTRVGAYYQGALGGGGVTEVNSLGRFMIQAVLDLSPVPVAFRSFYAVRNGKTNDIKWEISNEVNVSRYTLERSNQGFVFTQIGSLSANGSGSYSYTDIIPARGMNYYRLRIIDNDGRESLSEVRAVRNFSNADFVVFPNPVKTVARVQYESDETGPATLQVYNAEGKLVLQQPINLLEGSNVLEINTENLVTGVYSIILNTQRSRFNGRFIRQ